MSVHTDQDLLDVIDDDGEGLSSWEVGFVSDMLDRLAAGRSLSDAQRVKAEQILAERVR